MTSIGILRQWLYIFNKSIILRVGSIVFGTPHLTYVIKSEMGSYYCKTSFSVKCHSQHLNFDA